MSLLSLRPGQVGGAETYVRALVRHLPAPEVADGLRISIGTDADMDVLLRAIEEERHGGQ